MSAFLKLNSLNKEVETFKKQIGTFNTKYFNSLKTLDLAKIDLQDTGKVRGKLVTLKTEAESMVLILNGMFSGGLRQYAKTHQERQDSHNYGNYKRLQSDAEQMIAGLKLLIAHLNVLIGSTAESKREAVSTMALVKGAEKVLKEGKDQESILADGLGIIMILIALIQGLKSKLR